MPERRFPAPWTVEEYRGISYIVRDANHFAVVYVYFESELGPTRCREPHDEGWSEKDRGRHRQAAGAIEAADVKDPGASQS
jgi:hypothetical protein